MRNNRTAGHNYERQIINEISVILPLCHIGSSRLLSRYHDNLGIDIVDYPFIQGTGNVPFPFHVQCKNSSGKIDYVSLFEEFELKDKPFCIFHKATHKAKKNFVTRGEFVIIRKEDFYDLLKKSND